MPDINLDSSDDEDDSFDGGDGPDHDMANPDFNVDFERNVRQRVN